MLYNSLMTDSETDSQKQTPSFGCGMFVMVVVILAVIVWVVYMFGLDAGWFVNFATGEKDPKPAPASISTSSADEIMRDIRDLRLKAARYYGYKVDPSQEPTALEEKMIDSYIEERTRQSESPSDYQDSF